MGAELRDRIELHFSLHFLTVDQINVQLERCSLQWAAQSRRASCQKDDQEKGRKD